MRRLLGAALALCLLLFSGLSLCEAGDGTILATALEGMSSVADSEFTFTYVFPQLEVHTEADRAINAYYQALAEDIASGAAGFVNTADEPDACELNYEVAHASDRYVSIVLTGTYSFLSSGTQQVSLMANTFARDGLYAGQQVSLSQVLGLEQEGDELSDEKSMAETLAYQLVWQIVERESQNTDIGYLDGLSREKLEDAFYPESDFYLDEDGNIVFFIQAGVISAEMAGVLTFPFSSAELLSAVQQAQ